MHLQCNFLFLFVGKQIQYQSEEFKCGGKQNLIVWALVWRLLAIKLYVIVHVHNHYACIYIKVMVNQWFLAILNEAE